MFLVQVYSEILKNLTRCVTIKINKNMFFFSCFIEVPFGIHYSLLYTITVMAIWKFSISFYYCSLSDNQTGWSSFLEAAVFAFCCICFLVGAYDRPVLICMLVPDTRNCPLRSE